MAWTDTVAGGLSGGDITNLGSQALNSLGGPVLFFAKVLAGIFIFLAFVWAIWHYFLRWKIRVRIIKYSGGKIVNVYNDLGRIGTDEQGKTKLILLKTRKGKERCTCPVPAQVYQYKMGKFDYYDLVLDDNFQLHPTQLVSIKEDAEKYIFVKPRPEQRQAWARMEGDLIQKKYEKREKWRELIAPGVMVMAFVISFLILFFMFKEMGNGMGALAGAFNEVANACIR